MEPYFQYCSLFEFVGWSRFRLLIKLVVLTGHLISYAATSAAGVNTINVMSYGAKPNGISDCSKSFVDAWEAACQSNLTSSIIYVPKGRYLIAKPLLFRGCNNPSITFRISATLVAPLDYNLIGDAINWISFQGVKGVSIVGGAFDAKGTALWACKANATSSCPNGPATLAFTNSKDVNLSGLLSLNSKFFHIVINGCQNVKVEGVKIVAAGDSPNTDGIHVQYSTDVVITDTSIATGDDCISIGPGSSNLLIQRVRCGPGHGISIGSLARDLEEPGVQNVTVKSTLFADTQHGFRIKSWARPSSGFVRDVRFVGAIMRNVLNPIVIDQHYCPRNLNCPTQESGVKVSNVIFQGIRGTSATPISMKFDCSSTNPCTGIRLHDVNLTYLNQPSQSSCVNVVGNTLGLVQPNNCL